MDRAISLCHLPPCQLRYKEAKRLAHYYQPWSFKTLRLDTFLNFVPRANSSRAFDSQLDLLNVTGCLYVQCMC